MLGIVVRYDAVDLRTAYPTRLGSVNLAAILVSDATICLIRSNSTSLAASDLMTETDEFVKIWRPKSMAGIQLYSARLISQRYGKHFHEEYTIGINDAGVGSYSYCGERQVVGPGSLNLLTPGEVHTGEAASTDGWTYRNIYVETSLIDQFAEQLNWRPKGLPHFPKSVEDCEAWSLLNQAFRAAESSETQLEIHSLLLVAIRLLFERYGDRQPPERRVAKDSHAIAKARDYIQQRYSDEISLEELGRISQLSPCYLIRSFRNRFGMPPHAYQLQIRLHRAKVDLERGMPITAIALKHGFYDQSHFHRHFRRTFGVTPGAYRVGNSVQDR